VPPRGSTPGPAGPVARILAGRDSFPADLVVLVDDVALELGTIRVRERGSHGGHNGLRSLVETLGTEEFARVRIGVRRGELPAELAEYVLADFLPDEVLAVQEAVGLAADAVLCLVEEGGGRLRPAVFRTLAPGRAPRAPKELAGRPVRGRANQKEDK
jgi:peptidyl-tRNA hydrolase